MPKPFKRLMGCLNMYRNRYNRIFILLLVTIFAGCAQLIPPRPDDPRYSPITPNPVDAQQADNGAIYQNKYAMSLIETPRDRRIGDILTIKLIEKTNAAKKATTNQKQSNEGDVKDPKILGQSLGRHTKGDFSFNYNSDLAFDGSGESKQNNQLSGTISVTVSDVHPNGNLVVRGEKWLTLNQGREFIRLSGIVRAADITPDNTVTSDRVADARIVYSGTGQVADSNVMGWFSRFFWMFYFPY